MFALQEEWRTGQLRRQKCSRERCVSESSDGRCMKTKHEIVALVGARNLTLIHGITIVSHDTLRANVTP